MPELALLQAAEQRFAAHYASRLRRAVAGYTQGGPGMYDALHQFEQDWPQIQRGLDWSARNLDDPEAAALCVDYPRTSGELLALRQGVPERVRWMQIGIEAARYLRDEPAEVDLLVRLGNAHLYSGQIDFSEETHREALELALRIGYAKGEADARTGVARAISLNDRTVPEAFQHLEAALAIYRERLDDPIGLGWCLQNLGSVAERHGNLAAAQLCLEEALDLYRAVDHHRYTASGLNRLASIHERRGEYDTATELLHDALRSARRMGELNLTSTCLLTLGLIADYSGDGEASRRHFTEALDLSRRSGNQHGEATCYINLGYMDRRDGRYAEAKAHFAAALGIFRATNYGKRVMLMAAYLGGLDVLLGNFDAGRTALRDVLPDIHAVQDDESYFLAFLGFCDLAVHEGRYEDAAELLGVASTTESETDPDILRDIAKRRDRLAEHMESDALDKAYARGRSMDLNAVVERLLGEDKG